MQIYSWSFQNIHGCVHVRVIVCHSESIGFGYLTKWVALTLDFVPCMYMYVCVCMYVCALQSNYVSGNCQHSKEGAKEFMMWTTLQLILQVCRVLMTIGVLTSFSYVCCKHTQVCNCSVWSQSLASRVRLPILPVSVQKSVITRVLIGLKIVIVR